MKNIFVFTAGAPAARAHLADSILTAVSAELLELHLPAEEARRLQQELGGSTEFYAWGAVPGANNIRHWNEMQIDDVVMGVFDNRYRFVASVLSKVHSVELAKSIWGTGEDGNTWEYVYLLTKPNPVDVHVHSSPATDYLNQGYFGFTKISNDRIARIEVDYNSIDRFVSEAFSIRLALPSATSEIYRIEQATPGSDFDSENRKDARTKVFCEIVRRRGQPKFRRELLEAYGARCCVTGCDTTAVLEAAHIIGYLGAHSHHVTNGLLLRADIHTLFDLDLLRIDELGVVHVAPELTKSAYGAMHGAVIKFPADPMKAPNKDALAARFTATNA